MKKLAMTLALGAMMAHTPATFAEEQAPSLYIKTVEADFEDVLADLQDSIINQGLVIDYVGNVDNMLERTAKAVSSSTSAEVKSPYLHAKYMQFCSAKLTHKAVSADPQNLSMCPFLVFTYETHANPGKVLLGYRPPTLASSEQSKAISVEVNDFLKGVIDETVSNY